MSRRKRRLKPRLICGLMVMIVHRKCLTELMPSNTISKRKIIVLIEGIILTVRLSLRSSSGRLFFLFLLAARLSFLCDHKKEK